MRAAIYARVSSQAQRDAHTIENQLRALPTFVAAQGWTLAGTYTDDGRSAKAGKLEARDGFARLVRDADAGCFDVLVVVDIDRLTRTDDLEERARILGPFQRNNIQIVTPSGGALDLRTMLGELYVTMQALVAAEENRKRAERIKAGKLRAIAEGRKPAGPTPYGLAYSRVTGTWSIEPAAAAAVRDAFARVIAGDSCLAIANDFDTRGVRPPRGAWTRHAVWRLVRSRHPIGEWFADKRQRLAMAIPPLITEATWQAAQDSLIAHGKRGLRRARHVYLLEGLAVCGVCGSPMAIRSATCHRGRGNRVLQAAYVCRRRKLERRGEGRCAADIVPVADADARVWAAVAAELDDPQLAVEVQRRAESRAANQRDWQADTDRYRAHLARLARVEEAILGRFRRGAISDVALDTELAAIARERGSVGQQLVVAERAARTAAAEPVADPRVWLAALRELATSAAPVDRQRIVRAIVEPGSVSFVGRRIKLTLLVEAGAASRDGGAAAPALSVVGSGYSSNHETAVKIRLVA
jgi:site-specific DNA recombinase